MLVDGPVKDFNLITELKAFKTTNDLFTFLSQNKRLTRVYSELAATYWSINDGSHLKWSKYNDYTNARGELFEKIAKFTLLNNGWKTFKFSNKPSLEATNVECNFTDTYGIERRTEIDGIFVSPNGTICTVEMKSNPTKTLKQNQILLFETLDRNTSIEVKGHVIEATPVVFAAYDFFDSLNLLTPFQPEFLTSTLADCPSPLTR